MKYFFCILILFSSVNSHSKSVDKDYCNKLSNKINSTFGDGLNYPLSVEFVNSIENLSETGTYPLSDKQLINRSYVEITESYKAGRSASVVALTNAQKSLKEKKSSEEEKSLEGYLEKVLNAFKNTFSVLSVTNMSSGNMSQASIYMALEYAYDHDSGKSTQGESINPCFEHFIRIISDNEIADTIIGQDIEVSGLRINFNDGFADDLLIRDFPVDKLAKLYKKIFVDKKRYSLIIPRHGLVDRDYLFSDRFISIVDSQDVMLLDRDACTLNKISESRPF